jgi:magnesium transporter
LQIIAKNNKEYNISKKRWIYFKMMRSFVIKNREVIDNPSHKQIKKYLRDKKAVIWIDLQKPTDAEYNFLEKTFDFHHLSIEDCKKAIELPKIDTFEKYLFIVLYSVPVDSEDLELSKREIDFFLGKNFLVSLHSFNSPSVENQMDSLRNIKNGFPSTADFLMYQIIDYFVDLHFPLLNKWEDDIEKLEEDIIQHKHQRNPLKQIMNIKKQVFNLRKNITLQIDVINRFTKKGCPFICPKTSLYFKDVYDHLARVSSELDTQRDMLKNAFDTHTATISKQMTETSNRMNQVMQKLTIIATIFMPLTFITGVYGMNFRYMPELYWRYGYFIILGIMILVGLMMYWFFRKRQWM